MLCLNYPLSCLDYCIIDIHNTNDYTATDDVGREVESFTRLDSTYAYSIEVGYKRWERELRIGDTLAKTLLSIERYLPVSKCCYLEADNYTFYAALPMDLRNLIRHFCRDNDADQRDRKNFRKMFMPN